MGARVGGPDALRGLAVLFMLEVHLGYWWLREVPEDPLARLGTALGGMAAPLFLVLAGASLALSREHERSGFARRTAARGLLLFAAGTVFTFVEREVYGPLGWGVLQCIGVSLVACAPLMALRPAARLAAGALVLLLAPLLRSLLGVPAALYTDDLTSASGVGEYLEGALLRGFFPLLPWAGFVFIGSAAGEVLFSGGSRGLLALAGPGALGAGAGAAGLALGDGAVFFPPSLSFTLLSLGLAVLALAGARSARGRFSGALAPLGRVSLTAFVVHHLLGFEAFRAAGALHLFEPPAVLVMILLSWALALAGARAWARAGYRFSLERALSRALQKIFTGRKTLKAG